MVGHTLGYAELMIDSLLRDCPDEFLRRQLLHKRGELMSAKDKFQRELAENLEKEMYGGVAADNVSTGMFDTLLQSLLDAVVETVMNCMNKRNKAEIAASLSNPGTLERVAIKQAIRSNETLKDHRQHCYAAMLTTLKDTPSDELKQLVDEVETFRGFTI